MHQLSLYTIWILYYNVLLEFPRKLQWNSKSHITMKCEFFVNIWFPNRQLCATWYIVTWSFSFFFKKSMRRKLLKKYLNYFEKSDVYYNMKITVMTANAWKPTETSGLWVDPNNGEKKIERKRNWAKDSEESNFSGRPRRMGSIGKVGLLIKRRQRLLRRRPGVHHHWSWCRHFGA